MKVPEDEVYFTFARSGGPGGQNVNKLSTKVTLHWLLKDSKQLSAVQKSILLRNRNINALIDSSGVLNLVCQISRSQAVNRKLALEKLEELIRIALIPVKIRKKTKPSRSNKEKRIKLKKTRSLILKRRKIRAED